MPFAVREPKELEGLAPGAMVEFTLVVNQESSYAENIHIHLFQSLENDPQAAARLNIVDRILDPASSKEALKIGQPVPDFTLIDQNRRRVTLSQFAGKVVAITFIYTRCPLPDYCFRLSGNFGQLQKRFADQMGRNLVLLSITFDPAHDQPEDMAKYGSIWKADPRGWKLLTGPPTEVEKICRSFGIDSWLDEGLLIHSLHTSILDRQGRLAANLDGNEFSATQLGDLVQTVMSK